MRPTRGGELGRALGRVCSSGAKTVIGSRAALAELGAGIWAVAWVEPLAKLRLRANSAIRRIAVLGESDAIAARGGAPKTNPTDWGNKENVAFAVRRTAGPARWAFGPPGERAART